MHGNAAAMKTRTTFYASTSRKALIYRASAKPNSAQSYVSSTSGPERPCNIKPQQSGSPGVLHCSVEITALQSHSGASRRVVRNAGQPAAPRHFYAFSCRPKRTANTNPAADFPDRRKRKSSLYAARSTNRRDRSRMDAVTAPSSSVF